jgi:hypothetical protein
MPKRKLSTEGVTGLLETDLPEPVPKKQKAGRPYFPLLKNSSKNANMKVKAKGKAKAKPAPTHYGDRPSSLWKVGAHVSAAGGVENAIINAAAIG